MFRKPRAGRALVRVLILTGCALIAAAGLTPWASSIPAAARTPQASSIAAPARSPQAGPSRPFPMVGMLDWRLDPSERVKLLENRSFTSWLMTSDTTLVPGDSLTLLWNAEDADTSYAHDEPLLQRGRVLNRVTVGPAGPGNMHRESGDVFYHVAAPQPGDIPPGVGFAVRTEPGEFRRVGSRVEADLDRDGVAERFFTCSSYEGVHLTVWSGEPLKGEERWHRYYYVPYDTEPTCFSRDSVGIEGED